ncbi:MAG: RNA polymerase II [Lysinibacillus sp.]
MKIAVSLFSALVVVIGAMLFLQYQVYSDQDIPTNEAYMYSQEIEITYRSGSLDVRHHFKNLPNDELEIMWPDEAVDKQCFLEAEYSCARLSGDKTVFSEGENRSQSISYIIPVEGGLIAQKLMKNVYASLKNGGVQFSTVHISTDSTMKGQWVTGLPMIGQQALALVNYSMFSGTGQIRDLYWQEGGLALQKKTDALSLYGDAGPAADVSQVMDELPSLGGEHMVVIAGAKQPRLEGYRMLFMPQLTADSLKKEVLMKQVESIYDFGDSPLWLKHVVAMHLSGETFGTPRAKAVVEELKGQLSEAQMSEWRSRLEALAGSKVSPAVLDDELSALLGAYTAYFSMNVDAEQTYPFVYNDRRGVYVGEASEADVDVILYEGEVLYTADALLQALGYATSVGPNGYYVNSETRAFRFPDDEHGFYVFNQRRYNTVSPPFSVVAGTYYIKEAWLQRLFLVELQKDEQSIRIAATAQ